MSFFLAIEGADGSGTSTQTMRVAARLRELGYSVHETREPSTGPIGLATREALRQGSDIGPKTLALLFAADRLDHLDREVVPFLERGETCITDRYVLSSLVYQGMDCDGNWVASLNHYAIKPDLCVLLDIPPEVGAARRVGRGGIAERFDADDTQTRVLLRYREIASTLQIPIIDGTKTPEAITDTILQMCTERGL